MTIHNLDALFRPSSVAVVGASDRPGRLGTVVLQNLLAGGFRGEVLCVNPKYRSLGGRPVVPSVRELDRVPDLAVLCTPPATVPGIVAELAERGARAAAVLTAEPSGSATEGGRGTSMDAALAAARARGLRILGPNCLGILAPHASLDASFSHARPLPGRLAFVSQSGGLCTAMIDWSRVAGVGLSAVVSLGNALDVDVGDVVDWLGSDPETRAILLYLESVAGARKFLSAARAASRNKPIVALKAGRAPEGARAAASHTGALAGSDEVLDYALRRAGILRVQEFAELLDAAETLEHVRRPRGDRLAIVTNGGGPAVLATDALAARGGRLATLSPATLDRLRAALPATWTPGNPVDVIGDADAARYRRAVEIVLADPEVDALLLLYVPTAMSSAQEFAHAAVAATRGSRLPILCSWLAREPGRAAHGILGAGGLASYATPEEAVNAFLVVTRHQRALELLMETPHAVQEELVPDGARVRRALRRSLDAEGGWLSPAEAMEVLAAHGVPGVRTEAAADASAAVTAAERIGFPVALKVVSPDVLHKSDVGGVALDLAEPQAVQEAADSMRLRLRKLWPEARFEGFLVQHMERRPGAFEVFVGAAVDPVFGPFLMFGQGGTAIEAVGDAAVALPPLNLHLADELVARTRIQRLLRGFRGRPPVDLDALHLILVRISRLVSEVPELCEMDVNPLLVDADGLVAVDARIRVAPTEARGPDRLAIRPYPNGLEEEVSLSDGRRVLLRPIRPEDEPAHRRLFERFRPEDVRFRFFHLIRELPHSELARYTQIDYEREMAFVALDLDSGTREELGVVRAVTGPEGDAAEFSIIVAPDAAGVGLGHALLAKLLAYLRGRGVGTVVGQVAPENHRMLELARRAGFEVLRLPGAAEVEVRLSLTPAAAPAPAR